MRHNMREQPGPPRDFILLQQMVSFENNLKYKLRFTLLQNKHAANAPGWGVATQFVMN